MTSQVENEDIDQNKWSRERVKQVVVRNQIISEINYERSNNSNKTTVWICWIDAHNDANAMKWNTE